MDHRPPSWPCSPVPNVILTDSTFCVVGPSFGFEMHSPSEMPLFQGTEWLFNFHYVPSESLWQSASLHILGLMLLTHPCHFPIQSTYDPAFPSTTLKKNLMGNLPSLLIKFNVLDEFTFKVPSFYFISKHCIFSKQNRMCFLILKIFQQHLI